MDIVTGIKAWLAIRPVRRIKEARRRKRLLREEREALRQIGISVAEDTKMQIDIGTRTSTNALVGGGIFSQVYVQLAALLPWPQVVAAITTPEAVALVATGIAWAIARVSRTPANPGRL